MVALGVSLNPPRKRDFPKKVANREPSIRLLRIFHGCSRGVFEHASKERLSEEGCKQEG